jgi:cysteine desulfuration protein SufE
VTTIDDILADFDVIDDWEERYRYVIELGRHLEPLDETDRTEANKVRGCASQVWLATRIDRGGDGAVRLSFTGDSDAHIVKGLVAVMIALFTGHTAAEILAIDPEPTFTAIGLREHLTPQRANGVAAMLERVRSDARAALAASA